MKNVLVSTRNLERFYDAAGAVEARLSEPEIMGLGLIYGEPGLGKTKALASYHAMQSSEGRIRTVFLRAQAIWSVLDMLRKLIEALGCAPEKGKAAVFDQVADWLTRKPHIILIDEIQTITSQKAMVSTLKDIHDMTQCGIIMVGEESVEKHLVKFKSFCYRLNQSAVVLLRDHTFHDVEAVIQQRCEIPVQDGVCEAIFKEPRGKDMRFVVDRIREIERYAKLNGTKEIAMNEYRMISHSGPCEVKSSLRLEKESTNGEQAERVSGNLGSAGVGKAVVA